MDKAKPRPWGLFENKLTLNNMFTNIKDELPEPNALVLIQRSKGPYYLGYRNSKPISENLDASQECHWHGRPVTESDVKKSDSFFYCNFSDVTVIGWAPFGSVLKMAEKGIEVL